MPGKRKAEGAMERLALLGIEPGDSLKVSQDGISVKGILLPHDEFSGEDIFMIKLDSGYNTGFRFTDDTAVELIRKGEMHARQVRAAHPAAGPAAPRVAFIGTGGTIASFVDYRTGGVFPAFDADGIVSLVPELSSICALEGETLFTELSENFGSREWVALAREAASRLNSGYRGVLIAHGTDTMAYTSAALSFMLRNLTGPVVLTGAQRSPDRPSFDGYLNLLCSARVAALSDIGEVVIVMHSSISDNGCHVHRGTKARKMHSSRRDAFRSVNAAPIAFVDEDIHPMSPYRQVSKGRTEADTRIADRVALIQFYPGLGRQDFMDWTEGKRGIVVAGTGLGHVSAEIVKCIRKRVADGIPVVVTTQCLYGTTDLKVYSTGRDMIRAGAIQGRDMLPEVAYVKLRYVLGHHRKMEDIRRMMETDIAGELSQSRRGADEIE